MQSEERAILIYMEHRDWIALGAILTECREATPNALYSLNKREFLDYRKYVGTGNVEFFKPTAKGSKALLPWHKNMIDFVTQNWVALSGIILGLAAVIIGALSLK